MSDVVSINELHRHEPSTWMRHAILARLRALDASTQPLAAIGIVVLNLTDAAEDSREDRTCDRCRTYVPIGTTFFTGVHQMDRLLPHHQLLVFFGLCGACAALEVGHELGGEQP